MPDSPSPQPKYEFIHTATHPQRDEMVRYVELPEVFAATAESRGNVEYLLGTGLTKWPERGEFAEIDGKWTMCFPASMEEAAIADKYGRMQAQAKKHAAGLALIAQGGKSRNKMEE